MPIFAPIMKVSTPPGHPGHGVMPIVTPIIKAIFPRHRAHVAPIIKAITPEHPGHGGHVCYVGKYSWEFRLLWS